MSLQRLPAGKATENTGQSPHPPEKPGAANPPSFGKIPAILFEGDESAKPQERVASQKFDLGAKSPPESKQHETELPDAYGTGKLTLNARDSHSVFAHWDLTKDQQHRYNTLSADGHLILRAYAHAHSNQPAVEVSVESDSRHHFLNVPRAGTSYVGELGFYQSDRAWKTVATSGPTTTPPDAPSKETSAMFSTAEALRAPQAVARKETTTSDPSVIPVTAPRWPLVPEPPTTDEQNASEPLPDDAPPFVKRGPIKKWTPIQERLLADIIRVSLERREWISSAEITGLIQREIRLPDLVSPEIAWPVLPGAFANISSPMGGAQPSKGFWFNVNAELIIYGATDPSAQVTVAGAPIQLRPDGTFSCHFALPDGEYTLTAAAISPDNEHREAEMTFSRHTKYSG